MGNMLDYMDWRGDITLKQSPFHDVDNLIFSMISYLNFDGILEETKLGLTITKAYEQYCLLPSALSSINTTLYEKNVILLFQKMALSKRYGSMTLTYYRNHFDEIIEKQFSALMIRLGDGTVYLSFRGTDNSLTGWKENLNMSYQPNIPAQLEATSYLNHIPLRLFEKIRIGGHSKGGNLGIYAAAHCDKKLKKKIIEIYSNDAPGFHSEIIQSTGYQEILPKIRAFVPENSLVGMLLEHGEPYQVVQSCGVGLNQHDAFTWNIINNSFCFLPDITEESKLAGSIINTWIQEMDPSQKEQISNALAQFVTLSGESVPDLFNGNVKIKNLVHSTLSMDQTLRSLLFRNLKTLAFTIRNARWNHIKKNTKKHISKKEKD